MSVSPSFCLVAALHPAANPEAKTGLPKMGLTTPSLLRVRIEVEHTLSRMRNYQALNQIDRHHRKHHTRRVQAVAGLVNRQLKFRIVTYRLAA